MTDHQRNERFRVGDIWVTPGTNEIGDMRVEPKAIDVLLALVDAKPDPLSARGLLQRVWPGVVVVENVVYQAITQLRKALRDDARAPRFIENVPRRGYRLIAEVVREAATLKHTDRAAPVRSRHNLPPQLTSFIGREGEVAEVTELLAAHRLVTVIGVGGGGKTRLALTVANACLENFPTGVWLVELAPITDPAQVLSAVAKALGAGETAGEPLHESLMAVVEHQHSLVVLDNCEHLIDVCAQLAEAMLRKAPGLRILATSREALGIAGELPWRIQSLEVPDPSLEPTVEAMSRIASVRLFVERAATVSPAYALTVDNRGAIAHICQRLDGIPLAIELAAARVHTLSADDIARHLAESFRLLTGGSRTALPRQRTLQATLDWSHDLLKAPERILLRRLAVFADTFSLDAAEGVAGGDPLVPEDILEQLTRLIAQSMVQVVNSSAGNLRYRLLEPMRQYALEKLVQSGEVISTRDRHRDYFVGFGAEFADNFRKGIRSNGIYPRFREERDNFDLALTWCLKTDAVKGLALATSLCRFLTTYEPVLDTRWLEIYLARTPETMHERAEALCLSVMRDYNPSRRRSGLDEALALARATGDRWTETFALVLLGNTLALGDDATAGVQLVTSALDLARNAGDPNMLGWCLYFADTRRMPIFDARQCYKAFGSANNEVGRVLALRKWVTPLHAPSDDVVPREKLDELITLSRAQGFFQGIMVALGYLGQSAEQQGDFRRALRFMEEANDVAPASGLWATQHELARVCSRVGEFDRSAALFRDYLRRGLTRPAHTEMAFAQGLLGLAFVAGSRGNCALAARLYGASRRFRREIPRVLRGRSANETLYEDAVIRIISVEFGETVCATLCAEGAAMTLKQVMALATDEPNGVASIR